MLSHVQSEVSIEHSITPAKMIVLGGKDIEHNVIKTEVKEEPELSPHTEEMESHSFTCVQSLKCEESEYKEEMQEAVLGDTLNIKSQKFMDDKDMKYEVLVEDSIDIEEHKLIYKEDRLYEESEGAECLKSEGAGSAKNLAANIEDGCILTAGGKNIPEKQRTKITVPEMSSNKSINTHMLRSTDTTEINSELKINTSNMYTARNTGNVSLNNDNKCPNTNIDVDNSNNTHSKMFISNNGDDKYFVREHIHRDVVENKGCRERLHQTETGILNKHTETFRQMILNQCEICQVRFKNKSHLNAHLRTHTGERPFECEICKVRFKFKNNLKTHCRIHTGEKPFECQICQRKFNRTGSLKTHLRTHTGDKPFKCEICELRFVQSSNLNAHLKSHTDEKSFECRICQRKFSRTGSLKSHLRTHTGEKPFECRICQRKFSQAGSLKRHLKTHTGEKPFECEICELRFIQKSNLKSHLKSHIDEKRFKCKICHRKFNYSGSLKKHLTVHTGKLDKVGCSSP